jgi:RNA polymerase sigma-B factor
MSAPIPTLTRVDDEARDSRAERDSRTQGLLRQAKQTSCPKERQRLRETAAALNKDLALGVAYPFHGRGMDAEDIDQVALLGLWKAVLRYGPREDATFAAYAIPTITGEVKRHFRDHGWAVRPPRSLQERTIALARAADVLRHELQREPTSSELCGYLGVSRSELARASVARSAYQARSLDVRHPGTERTLGDDLSDPTDRYDQAETALTLRRAIDELCDRDRLLLRLRYGQGLTQSEIGERLGISQMHVSRLLQRISACLGATITQEAC